MTTDNNDRRRDAVELIAKHQFSSVEDTRRLVNGGVDPGKLRTRMVERAERAERASDLEYDDRDPIEIIAEIIARVKKKQAKMEADSALLDDELDASEMQADNSVN